ncbi:hypothetical protein KCV07_g434, partial [Aureobasidium melanogenum]
MSSKLLSEIGKGTSSGLVEAEVADKKECSGSCDGPPCEASFDDCADSLEDEDKVRCSDDEACAKVRDDDLWSASLEALERKVSLVKAVDRSWSFSETRRIGSARIEERSAAAAAGDEGCMAGADVMDATSSSSSCSSSCSSSASFSTMSSSVSSAPVLSCVTRADSRSGMKLDSTRLSLDMGNGGRREVIVFMFVVMVRVVVVFGVVCVGLVGELFTCLLMDSVAGAVGQRSGRTHVLVNRVGEREEGVAARSQITQTCPWMKHQLG